VLHIAGFTQCVGCQNVCSRGSSSQRARRRFDPAGGGALLSEPDVERYEIVRTVANGKIVFTGSYIFEGACRGSVVGTQTD